MDWSILALCLNCSKSFLHRCPEWPYHIIIIIAAASACIMHSIIIRILLCVCVYCVWWLVARYCGYVRLPWWPGHTTIKTVACDVIYRWKLICMAPTIQMSYRTYILYALIGMQLSIIHVLCNIIIITGALGAVREVAGRIGAGYCNTSYYKLYTISHSAPCDSRRFKLKHGDRSSFLKRRVQFK